jgi:hypothetical protein
MKKNMYKLITLLFVLGIFNFSCENGSLDQPELDMETSQDNALTEKAVGEIFGVIVSKTGTGAKTVGECPGYEFLVNVLTITYSSGCIGDDGLERTGTIVATFTNLSEFDWAIGTSATITFIDYFVDGKQLTGSFVVLCTSLGATPSFNISSEEMVLTFEDQKTVRWTFDTDLIMLGGWDSRDNRIDDTWKINGVTGGTARNGKTFSRETIDLITSYNCRYFISGIINLTIGESDTYKLEFKEPCGTVMITYKGIEIQQTLQ